MRKKHLGETKRLKKLFEQRKMRSRPCHRTDRHLICNHSTLRARKAATLAVKKSKKKSWEEFGRRLDSNDFSENKVFWQTVRRLRGKRSSITYSIKDSDGNILTD